MEFRTGTLAAAGLTALAWAVVWAAPGAAIEAIENIRLPAIPFASGVATLLGAAAGAATPVLFRRLSAWRASVSPEPTL